MPMNRIRWALGGLAVLFTAGIARTAAMAGVGEARPGLAIGLGILAGALGGSAVLWAVSAPARAQLLALKRPTGLQVLAAFGAGAALTAGFDAAAHAMGRPLVAADWVTAVNTAPPVLLPAALILTSVFEELFIRGYLQGDSKLGIPLTALLFAALHFPEDAFRFADVFCSGLLLGVIRHRTGSTLPGMAPHLAGNLKVLVLIAAA